MTARIKVGRSEYLQIGELPVTLKSFVEKDSQHIEIQITEPGLSVEGREMAYVAPEERINQCIKPEYQEAFTILHKKILNVAQEVSENARVILCRPVDVGGIAFRVQYPPTKKGFIRKKLLDKQPSETEITTQMFDQLKAQVGSAGSEINQSIQNNRAAVEEESRYYQEEARNRALVQEQRQAQAREEIVGALHRIVPSVSEEDLQKIANYMQNNYMKHNDRSR